MSSIANRIIEALHMQDAARPRSLQTKIGPSALGGCRRQVWSQMNDAEKTNPNVLRLPAVMGTSIHGTIESALRNADLWNELELEVEVSVGEDGELVGHVDIYDEPAEEAVDVKTSTKKSLAGSYWPSLSNVWQVQTYGWMLEQNGKPVKTVTLVGIPRDGTENDIVVWSEPYDPAVALEALAWLEEVESAEEPPAPERDAVSFCSRYCDFFDASGEVGCPGRQPQPGEVTIDGEYADIVRDYLAAKAEADAIDARLTHLRDALVGVSGRTEEGATVSWSSSSRSTIDRDAVQAAMGKVPMKEGKAFDKLNVVAPKVL